MHEIKHVRFQSSVYIENSFDLTEETDLTELNKIKTMASQQFKKVKQKNKTTLNKTKFLYFSRQDFEYTGENNTLYYTNSLLSNGLYSIIYSHYFLKIKAYQ